MNTGFNEELDNSLVDKSKYKIGEMLMLEHGRTGMIRKKEGHMFRVFVGRHSFLFDESLGIEKFDKKVNKYFDEFNSGVPIKTNHGALLKISTFDMLEIKKEINLANEAIGRANELILRIEK